MDNDSTVKINLTAKDGPCKASPTRPVTAMSKISKIFSEGSVSEGDSDSDDDDLGISPLKSNFLSYQVGPGEALCAKARPKMSVTTELAKKQQRVIRTLRKELQEDELRWIEATFSRKECATFVQREEGRCGCGRPRSAHPHLQDSPGLWSSVQHCDIAPTDAFGLVRFSGGSYNTARYARLGEDSDCEDLIHLLKEVWNLNMPGVLISALGSGKEALPHRLLNTFQRDVAKVGKLTAAWIVTDGDGEGVSSLVGTMLATHGYPVPAIAFPHWGEVQGRESLLSEPGQSTPAHYSPSPTLEPHHTHYLLVDDGSTHITGCNETLRREFEHYLANMFHVPLLYMVIGGTEEDGLALCSLLKAGFMVVLVKGSGGFAEDYCDFHAHLDEQIEITARCSCFQGSPCETIIEKMDHDFEISILLKVWASKANLSIYDYTRVSDFDAFVLKALVSAGGRDGIEEQLNLACKWSRVDVAEHILAEQLDATKGARFSSGLTKTLFHALAWGYPDFCGMLIENGADILDIQANMVSLYESAYFSPRCSHVIQLLEKYTDFVGARMRVTRTHVNQLLEVLIGRQYVSCSGYEEDPFYELTLWAALMLRPDLAILLWRYTQDPVRCSLVVTLMMYSLKGSLYLEKDDDKRRVNNMYQTFEDMAINVTNQAYLLDADTCRRAMLSKWARLRNYNYLDLAFHSHARNYMALPACQEIISGGWRGQFKRDTSMIRILVVLLCPLLLLTPLVPFDRKVLYRRAVQGRYRIVYIGELRGTEALYHRISAFYSAPVTKFWLNILAYLVFLGFHTYNLLANMRYIAPFDITRLAWTEVVVWVWLALMIVGELQEVLQSFIKPNTKLGYMSDSWNRMDLTILTIYVIGLGFRITPSVAYYQTGRTLIAVGSVPMFIKLLMLFEYKPNMGPFLLMLREMTKDLGIFLLLLGIFLVGFGVSYLAILVPPARFSWSAMSMLFIYPYFQMFGDFYLEVFELQEVSGYVDKTWGPDDPDGHVTRAQGIVSVVLLVVWVMISTVVLVNLLIAMFSDTYRTIKDNQVIIWKYQRYKMLSQYRASMLPPPLNVSHYLARAVRLLCKMCSRKVCNKTAARPVRNEAGDHWKDCMIRTFMQDARDEYLNVIEESSSGETSKILTKLQSVEKHLNIIRRVGNTTSSLYA